MAINLNHIDNSVLIGTSETVRIKSNGKVAIGGYGDPNSILDVRENKDGAETQIRLWNTDNGDTTTQTAAFYLSPDSRGNAVTGLRAIKENADFSNNAGRDVALTLNTLQNNSQQERLRITSTGFIGIGSAIPEAKLDVRGNINFQNSMLVSNWDSNGASGSNIDHIWHSDSSGYGTGGTWNFCSDAAAKVTGNSAIQIGFLKSSGGGHLLGDVGIGITNTTQKLHVDGSILLTGQLMQSTPADFWSQGNTFIELNGLGNLTHMGGYETCLTSNGYRDTNAQWKSYATNSTTGAAQIRLNPAGYIAFGTESNKSNGSTHVVTERVRIDASGHVQIGGSNEVQLTATNHEILYLHGAISGGADVDHAWAINIDMDDDDGGTTTSDRERGSIFCDFHGNNTGGDTSNETRLWNIYSDVEVSGDYDDVRGVGSDLMHSATSGTTSNFFSVYGFGQKNNAGTLNNMYGVYGVVQNTTGSSGTVTDMVAVRGRVNLSAGSGAGTATDIMGVWANIDNDNEVTQGGGKCFLFYGNYDKTTGLNNPYGVYITTNVPNYFDGEIRVGTTSSAGKLTVDSGTSNTCATFQSSDSGAGINLKDNSARSSIEQNGVSLKISSDTGAEHANSDIRLQVDGATKMLINSVGKVGVNEVSNINGRLHVQHDALAENILYATRYNDQGNDKPILAITEAVMSTSGDSALVIGNHNRDIHIGPIFDSSAAVTTTNGKGILIKSNGRVLISDDIGSTTHQPNEFPADNRQLMVYTSTNGQPIGNQDCARLLIATDAKQTGAQGYHGSIDFGSSDATAASGATEFNWRTAAIMCRGDGDTSPSIADGDLQFWTKSASGTMTHRFDIAPNGNLTATDTSIGSLSDQRLKTNIQDYSYDLDKFKQLKTRTFDWINPEFHQEGNIRGFIAQEIETVDPYWNYQFEVSKETAKKDYDLLSDGDENYTIIDHRPGKASKLNGKDAMYVSVIQQLMSKIETLETKVAALEGS